MVGDLSGHGHSVYLMRAEGRRPEYTLFPYAHAEKKEEAHENASFGARVYTARPIR